MTIETSLPFPFGVTSQSGLRFEFNANGSIRRMDHGDIMINMYLGNEVEGGPANLYLRRLGSPVEAIPLLGPRSPAHFEIIDRGLIGIGRWDDLVFRVRFMLSDSASAWFWHVELENQGLAAISCDLIHVQDVALADYGAVRLNEYYVSQYVDHTPLQHATQGMAVASRQNQSMGGRYPWTVIGSLGKGVSFATDALQFHGLANRSGLQPMALASGLPGRRLQHEHSMVGIQDEAAVIESGGKRQSGFFGWFEADRPAATSESDVYRIDELLSLPEAICPPWPADVFGKTPSRALFASAPFLEAADLVEGEISELFGDHLREVETENGRRLSFFTGRHNHVVLKAKEIQVLRPHGHLLRSGGALIPDESVLTSTTWMGGVFHSMVTQGHVSINRFLSTCHSYLSFFRSHGQRVFVEQNGEWHQLGLPSAFEMSLDSCRWIYRHSGGLIEVISRAPDHRHELLLSVKILAGDTCRFLITHHVAMNGDDGSSSVPVQYEMKGRSAFVRAITRSDIGRRFPEGGFVIGPDEDTEIEAVGGDEWLFADGLSRDQPFLCFVTASSRRVGLRIQGRLVEAGTKGIDNFWESIAGGLHVASAPGSSLSAGLARTVEIFPWFIHNALVHYLSPRGLEQYSGGGWGTRDVCQGPVELLLALGQFESVRDLICRVFRQQNGDGDWPQWFMFFDRERNIRPGDSHGDIIFWPLVALGQYLSVTGDIGLLEERLPYFCAESEAAAETGAVSQHLERALALIEKRVIAGTRLATYGQGDWNDSLQPARSDMRERLCSSWTVTLNYQMLLTLCEAFRRLGNEARAAAFELKAASILEEFQRVLIVNDVLSGLAYFHEDGQPEYLLHPSDDKTGLSYSLLPMIHAIINEMFTPSQAETHLALIRKHLLGPDGAHLFDRPMPYHGGIKTFFQRAESASYFGREIGLMYTHAHLRYCEALARYGDAEAFFDAIGRINPIAIREVVSTAGIRQANCYYSSSDAAFADRYEAYEDYEQVNRREVTLEGGWRVYSSGAGIATRLIMQCFLGVVIEQEAFVFDPLIPSALDQLRVQLFLTGYQVEITYRVQEHGRGPIAILLNETLLPFIREKNLYRKGAARVDKEAFVSALTEGRNQLTIELE